MNLNKSKSNRKNRGFTIVELLVVIVVIGILAAITIVSYTGFTTRAKASQTQANANSVLQVVSAYTADSTANSGGNGAFGTVANINAYTYTKLPTGVTITAAGATHPVAADLDGNGIGILYYSATADTKGGCIAYWDTAKSGGAGVTTLFMGTAISYATTGVCS